MECLPHSVIPEVADVFLCVRPLMFANWLYSKEKQTFSYVHYQEFWNLDQVSKSAEVRHIPSHWNWDMGTLPSLMITFQRNGSQVLEKESTGLINCQETFKNICISKGQRKNYKFCKVNAFKKRKIRKKKIMQCTHVKQTLESLYMLRNIKSTYL